MDNGAPSGAGNNGLKDLGAQARKRRLSESSYGRSDSAGVDEGIKYGYILAELFYSPRHTRVPLEVRSEQLLVIAAHFCSAMRTWEPGDAVDEPPFVRRGTVVGRGALREVSAAEAQAATPALSRRSAGQSTPAVRLRPAIVEAGSGTNAELCTADVAKKCWSVRSCRQATYSAARCAVPRARPAASRVPSGAGGWPFYF